jgi:hypothetical protein
MDVASDLISNVESYQQLLTTLSLGISAGAFAMVTKVVFHNATEDRKIVLKAPFIIFVGITIEFLSICFGIATKSALVSSVPALHAISWGSSSATEYLRANGLSHISVFAGLQIVFFAVGVIVLLSLMLVNWRMVRGR